MPTITPGKGTLQIYGRAPTVTAIQKSTYFQDNLLRFLPAEYQSQDDLGAGDLAAYMEVVTITIDELDDYVRKFPRIFDVDLCEAKYLPYIANVLGYPLDERDTEADQREQLRNAVSWYRRKGLEESFRILFYSLGYIANLVELWTEDYETFHRYPGFWRPALFPPEALGTSEATVSITLATRNLYISIDGSTPQVIKLTVGEDIPLATVAAEIDAALHPVGGYCTVKGGVLTVASRRSGEFAFVSIRNIENSAYDTLDLVLGDTQGIDHTVPNGIPELLENGGTWYKSPHFGIEVFSIKDYVTNSDEIQYLKDRLEMVRPVHTVLEFLTYLKNVSDNFEVREDDYLGALTPEIAEVWPFPICMKRNAKVIYIRDGMVPDRSVATAAYYDHIRNGIDNTHKRGDFVYNYGVLQRDEALGPPEMPNRSKARFFRAGVPIGQPLRVACDDQVETLEIDLAYGPDEPWTSNIGRRNGFILRDTTELRDGSFSRFYTRNNGWINRGRGAPVPIDPTDLGWGYYSSQNAQAFTPASGQIQDQTYIEIPIPGGYYKITSKTVLEFDFEGLVEGEVQGIGLDNDSTVNAPVMVYKIWGTDAAGALTANNNRITADGNNRVAADGNNRATPEFDSSPARLDYDNYFPGLGVRSYSIPIGQHFSGEWASRVVLVSDGVAGVCNVTSIQLREVGVENLDHEQVPDRSGANPVLESTDLLFERPDLPGIWFPTLAAMNDPAVLNLPDLPGPDT